MPIHSIEPRRLYRQIADQIRALIRSREFAAGARLPPERDLARQLGVSRPSVREALIGIYVLGSRGNGESGTPVQAAMGPFELLRARWIIESECAALAAKVAKRPQIAAIEEALQQMESVANDDKRQPLAGDRLFHLRIAEATGNGALVAVVKMLWEERMGPLFAQLEHHYDSPSQWTRAIAEHRLVLDAIGKHDVSGARAAMQGHLDRAYRRFSKSWDAKH